MIYYNFDKDVIDAVAIKQTMPWLVYNMPEIFATGRKQSEINLSDCHYFDLNKLSNWNNFNLIEP